MLQVRQTGNCLHQELLGMRVIDQIIQEEVAYYKQIYEKDGLQGLLEQL